VQDTQSQLGSQVVKGQGRESVPAGGMWWKILLFTAMCGVIALSFYFPPPMNVQVTFRDASRIFYYHVPIAWVTVVAYFTAIFYGIRYLKTRDWRDDQRAVTAAGLGTVFCILATISGSIFAKVAWGSFWNWDPREVSIFVLLLIYGSYFSLRTAVRSDEAKGSLSAVYSILAIFAVPFFIFIMPRMDKSLHPAKMELSAGSTLPVFLVSLTCFTVLFFWMLRLAFKVSLMAGAREREF
jgi:heme exporter protein C